MFLEKLDDVVMNILKFKEALKKQLSHMDATEDGTWDDEDGVDESEFYDEAENDDDEEDGDDE